MKVGEDPRFTQAVQNYEAGLKALQIHKYDKAKIVFREGCWQVRVRNWLTGPPCT